jgi:hypothetical protein
MEREFNLMKFKSDHPDWQQHEPAMMQKLNEPVSTPYGVFPRYELVNAGFMSYQDVYTMAKASQPQANTQEVLQSIANKQRAGGITPNAINSAPQAKSDPIIEAIKRARGES